MKHVILTPEGVIEKEFTADEVAAMNKEWDADQKTAAELYAKKTKAKADRKAGNEKLLSLGLTQAQVTALTNYDPSTET